MSLMSHQHNLSSWTKMQSFPFKFFAEPLFINNEEFVVVPCNFDGHESDGIYTFNINKNKWNKFIEVWGNFECEADSVAYDPDNRLLHVPIRGKLLQFDLKKNKFVSVLTSSIIGKGCKLIFVEQELHLICSMASNEHYILYHGGNEFKKIHAFSSFVRLYDHNVVYLRCNKSILLFGGKTNESVYKYSVTTQKWNKLKIKMPSKLSEFGLVKTQNEAFCVILGGFVGNGRTDKIFAYNTKNNVFIESKILCPKKGSFRATISNDPERDKLVSSGFIRSCYKSQLFSLDLVDIISRFICNQEIYLLERGRVNGQHWNSTGRKIRNCDKEN